MNSKRFTLIELIVSIVVLGILLAIVLVNINSSKKEAIRVAVSSNTKIIQSAVDTYFLKENIGYPTLNQEKPTIYRPALVDVDTLVEEGLIKQDLDLSKIKSQYYWLDSMGTVWGATEDVIKEVAILDADNERNFYFMLDKEYKGYNIYKILEDRIVKVDSEIETQFIADSKKSVKVNSYRHLYEGLNDSKERVQMTIPVKYANESYLISGIDQYGLETVPVGQGSGSFKPLIERDGTFFYQIESQKKMYFIDFWDWTDTPGDSKVEYRFSVQKEKDGEYSEWLNTFDEVLALETGYGVEVEITMTGDNKGNYPSVYDLHILYSFEKNKPGFKDYCYINPQDCKLDFDLCSQIPHLCNVGKPDGTGTGGGTGTGTGTGTGGGTGGGTGETGTGGGTGGSDGTGGTGGGTDGTGGGTGGTGGGTPTGKELCAIYPQLCIPTTCVDSGTCLSPETVCGSGKIQSGVKDGLSYLTINFVLKDNEKLGKVHIPSPTDISGSLFKSMQIQYAVKGADYQMAKSAKEVPAGACVNVVYIYEVLLGFPPPPPETCEVNGDCPVYCEDLNNCPVPEDEDYVTVRDLKLFSHSAVGSNSKWTGYRKEDVVPEHTRILYKFATGERGVFGSEQDDFPTGVSSPSIMAHVYFQVKKEFVDTVQEPTLKKFVFQFDGGEDEVNLGDKDPLEKPQVEIAMRSSNAYPYSTETTFEWNYKLTSSHSSSIVDVEWKNKQDKYAEGNYTVAVRVLDKNNQWSDWSSLDLLIVKASEIPSEDLDIEQYTNVTYINPNRGNDQTGDGSFEKPYYTIEKGLSKTNNNGTLYLTEGSHTLTKSVEVGKNLTILGAGEKTRLRFVSADQAMFLIKSDSTVNFIKLNISMESTHEYPFTISMSASTNTIVNIHNTVIIAKKGVYTGTLYDFGASNSKINVFNSYLNLGGHPVIRGINTYTFTNSILVNYSVLSFEKAPVLHGTLLDAKYVNFKDPNVNDSRTINKGVGLKADGTLENIGLYGGKYSW